MFFVHVLICWQAIGARSAGVCLQAKRSTWGYKDHVGCWPMDFVSRQLWLWYLGRFGEGGLFVVLLQPALLSNGLEVRGD